MYSTCLFCHADLGTNEVIESFQIGRRLAFDAVRGRLWVVCRRCERWNLTPSDERWEAVEQCERIFTSTKLRVSSENIGLCRVREGLELVRIGKPQRPEMAAWRYGDQFGKRRRRYLMMTGGAVAAAAGLIVIGPSTGLIAGGGFGMFQLFNAARAIITERIVRTRVAIPGRQTPVVLRRRDLKRVVIGRTADSWSILVPVLPSRAGSTGYEVPSTSVTLEGDDALRAAATILPAINSKGARKEQVGDAVRILESVPDAHALFAGAAGGIASRSTGITFGNGPIGPTRLRRSGGEMFLDRVPRTVALALEMASHEDIERRAMEGELAMLEQAWKQAEEIAGIADSLLVPADVEAQFAEIKKNASTA